MSNVVDLHIVCGGCGVTVAVYEAIPNELPLVTVFVMALAHNIQFGEKEIKRGPECEEAPLLGAAMKSVNDTRTPDPKWYERGAKILSQLPEEDQQRIADMRRAEKSKYN